MYKSGGVRDEKLRGGNSDSRTGADMKCGAFNENVIVTEIVFQVVRTGQKKTKLRASGQTGEQISREALAQSQKLQMHNPGGG